MQAEGGERSSHHQFQEAKWQGRVFTISGTSTVDTREVLGRLTGHFGKAVIFGLVRRLQPVAASLLVDRRLGLAEIARRVGLCDDRHLGRLFRRRYGMSPGAWRRAGLA